MFGKDRLALISRNPDLEVETVLKTVAERHGAVYRTVSTLEKILQVTNQQTNNSYSRRQKRFEVNISPLACTTSNQTSPGGRVVQDISFIVCALQATKHLQEGRIIQDILYRVLHQAIKDIQGVE